MTFDDDARIDSSKVTRRRGGRGRTTGIAAGGGGLLVVVAVILVQQFTGVDLSQLVGGGAGGGTGSSDQRDEAIEGCTTGREANASVECRMAGAADSLDTYWAAEAPAVGIADYASPGFSLFDAATTTGCGEASSATGPFYCPPDRRLFVDTSFFDELRTRFGASGGPLAQMYVVGHEWGHHIQQLTGAFDRADRRGTGPDSDSVRLEVQADCYAGAWIGAASQVRDDAGTPFLEPVTAAEVADALDAAAAVGDDRIQASGGGGVDPDTWTHGSAEQRQRWFETGRAGGPTACDTFAVAGDRL
ncbi:neutral zinc metallopeptidase [Clavibacter tessellarius]|uniref:Neutral zinc metallopeptidase n=1 Tax=Clavibacter tessellarius TaxID=31965 RepID=A0A225CEC0_9MICO|nr:neutral zinc metallopeptidase [Clavibacter michiganensis]OQJ64120.1 neutral zinc metallopeptidase [Clavibacter michiganensis subsp. tessellarius]UKF32908.1 neutral zinc metallopeptidase [Clavibacter michiganensis subsp. tessellarius]